MQCNEVGANEPSREAEAVRCGPIDYEDAATIYRTCRRRGETLRKLIDCLIAAHALREHIPILHSDSDFDAIARHTQLQVDA